MGDQFSENFRNQQLQMRSSIGESRARADQAYLKQIRRIEQKFTLEKESALGSYENLLEKKKQATETLGTVGGLIENTVLSRHLIQQGVQKYVAGRKRNPHSAKKQTETENTLKEEPDVIEPLKQEYPYELNRSQPDDLKGFGEAIAYNNDYPTVPDVANPQPLDYKNLPALGGEEGADLYARTRLVKGDPEGRYFFDFRPGTDHSIQAGLTGIDMEYNQTLGQRIGSRFREMKKNIKTKFQDIKETIQTKFSPKKSTRLSDDYAEYPFRGTELGMVGDPKKQSLFNPSEINYLGGENRVDKSSRWDSRNIFEVPDAPGLDDYFKEHAGVPSYPDPDEVPTNDELMTRLKALAPNPEELKGTPLESFEKPPPELERIPSDRSFLRTFGDSAPYRTQSVNLDDLGFVSSSKITPLDSREMKSNIREPPSAPEKVFGDIPADFKPVDMSLVEAPPIPIGKPSTNLLGTVVQSTPVDNRVSLIGEGAEEASKVGESAFKSTFGKIASVGGAGAEIGGGIASGIGTYQAFKSGDTGDKVISTGQDADQSLSLGKTVSGIIDKAKSAQKPASEIGSASENVLDDAGDIASNVAKDTAGDIAGDIAETGLKTVGSDLAESELAGLGAEASESIVPVVGEGLALATGVGFTIAGLVKSAIDLGNQLKNPTSKIEQRENQAIDTHQNNLNLGGRFVAPNQVSIYNQSSHFNGF